MARSSSKSSAESSARPSARPSAKQSAKPSRPSRTAAADGARDGLNIVVLIGRLSSAPTQRTLASGSVLWTLEVTVAEPEGTTTAPVSWLDPPSDLDLDLDVGSPVAVLGSVRRRFFRTGAGTQSRTEVAALQVVRADDRAQLRRLLARAHARLPGSAANGQVRS